MTPKRLDLSRCYRSLLDDVQALSSNLALGLTIELLYSTATITAGTVGTLQTKTGQYRILNEADFQQLVGLATDVERLQQGLSVVMRAVRVVENHPEDADTLALLVTQVASYERSRSSLN